MLQTWLDKSRRQLVIVIFSASWSGSTHILKTYLTSITKDLPNTFTEFVDVEKYNELAGQFNVNQVPTMVLLKNAETVAYIKGTISKKRLKSCIEEHL